MSKVMKCPKCGGEMKTGYVRNSGGQIDPVDFTDKLLFWERGKTESTRALACRNCGYIELYTDRKE